MGYEILRVTVQFPAGQLTLQEETMLSDGRVCFCPAGSLTRMCRSARKRAGMVFSNISPAHDLDIAGLLVKCVGDTQLRSLLMHWMTESGFRKISTERTDELQFRRLNLIGINVNSCTWVKKKDHICLLPYSHPAHFPYYSLGDLLKTQIRSCHFLAKKPLTASHCLEVKDKTR